MALLDLQGMDSGLSDYEGHGSSASAHSCNRSDLSVIMCTPVNPFSDISILLCA